MIKKALVLAAGYGNRLRPFTCAVPKPLLPVWGETMLARMVRMLREWGVEDIMVNCHYLHEQVEAWCAENGCKVSYEPEILGTGGAVNKVRDWIGNDCFYLVNGDVVVEGVGSREKGIGEEEIGWCWVTEEGPRTIEVEPESKFVTNWKSDDAGYDGTFTYCGIAALKPEILKYVEPQGFSTIIQAYERAMMDGKFMRAIAPKGLLWTDAGTIASYIEVNRAGEENGFASIPQIAGVEVGGQRLEVEVEGGGKIEVEEGVEFLGARGSERVFFRRGNEIIIVYDDAKRVENARYAGHARWLAANGISVPKVLVERKDLKTLVLEWAGEEKKMSLEEDVKVIEELAKFNALGEKAAKELELEPAFDAALYKWERDLFEEHCLGTRFHREMPGDVRKELEQVAAILEREPKALVHRDFQSTNVLWKGGKLTFIDFQGMRLGAAAYDVASYVYDPYREFTEGERRGLIGLYAKKGHDVSKIVHYAAVQRLVQCLGAYGRLASVGQASFGKWVLPALQHLLLAADEANLDAIGGLAEELIGLEMKAKGHEG